MQHELAGLAREKVPQSQIYVLDHFLETDILLSRIKEAIQFPKREEKKEIADITEQKRRLLILYFCIKTTDAAHKLWA